MKAKSALARDDAPTAHTTHVPTYPDWLDRQLYPFDGRYLDIDGNQVHYVDEGAGPVLLLLHGNPCDGYQLHPGTKRM